MGGTGVRVWRAPVGAGGGAGEEREAERHRQAKDNTVCVCVCGGGGGLCAKSLQLCPTLGSPIDCSPPGSSVHGILQTRILEWVVMASSRGSSHALLQRIRPRD